MSRADNGRRRRWAIVAFALLALLWLCSSSNVETRLTLRLRVKPDTLAHFLADFSNEPAIDERVVSWSVLEESRERAVWQYRVRYEGAGVSGEVVVRVGEQQNRIAALRYECEAHAVLRTVCWKEDCVLQVSADGDGVAEYAERCAVVCGLGACGGHHARRERRGQRLVALLRAKGFIINDNH